MDTDTGFSVFIIVKMLHHFFKCVWLGRAFLSENFTI